MPDSPKPRVLYLTHRVPFPPDKGDRIRNFHVLRQLARHAAVSLVALADEPVPDPTRAALGELCEQVEFVPVRRRAQKFRAAASALVGGSLSAGAFADARVAKVARDWHRARPFDAVLVSTGALAPYLLEPPLNALPRFIDLVDVDSQKWRDFAGATRGPKAWLYRLEARRLAALEASLPKWAAAVTLVSRAEADIYEAFAGTGTALVARNGVDLEYYRPRPDAVPEDGSLAFVGAMDYRPNVDAVAWFAAAVWPRVRQNHPGARFRVVGRKPTAEVQNLAKIPGVDVLGTVPDVRPFVEAAAVVVAPMRLSRGLQNKVLEAMAMAKAVVCAPPALAALAVIPGTHLLQAQTTDEWLAAINGLLADPARRRELGAAARQFVETHHHWDECLRPLTDAILDQVALRHPAPAGAS